MFQTSSSIANVWNLVMDVGDDAVDVNGFADDKG